MSPTFSIIIPVYNVAPYLRECLDSVLAQTYTDWEAICVDDGSTDGSGAILDEYAVKDSRFRILHQPNRGVSAARNAALDVAQGEWIGFIDADDAVTNWYLKAVSVGVSSVSAQWARINGLSDIEKMPPSEGTGMAQVITGDEVIYFLWKDVTKINGGFGCLNWFRNDFISGHRFMQGVRFAEDTIFQLTLISKCAGIVVVDAPGYRYRYTRSSSASNTINYADVIPLLNVLISLVEENEVYASSPWIRRPISFLVNKTIKRVVNCSHDSTLVTQIKMSSIIRRLNKVGITCCEDGTLSERLAWNLFATTGLMIGFKIIRSRHYHLFQMILSLARVGKGNLR